MKCFKCGRVADDLVEDTYLRELVCPDQGRCSSRRHGVDRWNWVGSSINPDLIKGADSELSKKDCFKNIAESRR
jgi:hypothetical protein